MKTTTNTSVYEAYNNRELMMAQKALASALVRAKNNRAKGSGNLQTRININLRAVNALMAQRGL